MKMEWDHLRDELGLGPLSGSRVGKNSRKAARLMKHLCLLGASAVSVGAAPADDLVPQASI
jgi:hypothetical protein